MLDKKEKIKQNIKRSTSESILNEHHKNYLKFNRSEIFKPDQIKHREETSIERMRNQMKSSNLKEFMTKYENTYPIRRKYKFGILKKQIYNEETKLTSFTPKERKIKELYPQLDRNEIKQVLMSTTITSKNEGNSYTNTITNQNYNSNLKKLKLDNMYRSNVFNDSNKYDEISTNTSINNKPPLIFANMDWRKENTEIIFNREYKNKRLKQGSYNPSLMKQIELSSHMNSKLKDSYNEELPKKNKDFKEIQFEEISKNYSKHVDKVKENASSMHPKDFYKRASKADVDNIKTIPFEIKDINNISEFNVKEIKALLSKNGFHAYDIHVESKLGKDEGNMKFKVRTDNETRLKKIQDKITGLGFKCYNTENKTKDLNKNNKKKTVLVYDNNYKNDCCLNTFKNDIKFIEKQKK